MTKKQSRALINCVINQISRDIETFVDALKSVKKINDKQSLISTYIDNELKNEPEFEVEVIIRRIK